MLQDFVRDGARTSLVGVLRLTRAGLIFDVAQDCIFLRVTACNKSLANCSLPSTLSQYPKLTYAERGSRRSTLDAQHPLL